MRLFVLLASMLTGCLCYRANGNGTHHQLRTGCAPLTFAVDARVGCSFMRVERYELLHGLTLKGTIHERVRDLVGLDLRLSDPSMGEVLSIVERGGRMETVLRMRRAGQVRLIATARAKSGRSYRDEFLVTVAQARSIRLACNDWMDWKVGRRVRCLVLPENLEGVYLDGVRASGGLRFSRDAESTHDQRFLFEATDAGAARVTVPGGLEVTIDVASSP